FEKALAGRGTDAVAVQRDDAHREDSPVAGFRASGAFAKTGRCRQMDLSAGRMRFRFTIPVTGRCIGSHEGGNGS
ncbi:hypothetical protein, partial [Plasticicumulans sp.]|uniref:hypothetical protein n=1 Tax=Plasticicumulans sp. TaxID=2307179 RepID=UPI002BAC0641